MYGDDTGRDWGKRKTEEAEGKNPEGKNPVTHPADDAGHPMTGDTYVDT